MAKPTRRQRGFCHG